MNILILSDLHIGTKARAADLCPYPEGNNKDKNLVSTFIQKAKEYQHLNGQFDFVVIPGDITNQSNIIEYIWGDKFVSKILKELSIEDNKVIFVPGNHDVDWSVVEGKTIYEVEKQFRRALKYNTLKDERHRFSKYSNPELIIAPYIKVWEHENIDFVGFNSSWHDDSIEDKHYGLIDTDHINGLEEEIKKLKPNKIKIFVVHHHLHQFLNPHPMWRDISIMQNAQPLLELLTTHNFNFILHGHRHVPNFLSTSINGSKPIHILCAGSYCCEVPTEIAGHIGNMFHVLRIEDIKNNKGRIFTWAYDTRVGWIESREHNGMEYENPFGIEIEFEILLQKCIDELTPKLNGLSFFSYSQLVTIIPDLNYLQLSQKKKLLTKLEEKCKVRVAIDSSKEVIFIKY